MEKNRTVKRKESGKTAAAPSPIAFYNSIHFPDFVGKTDRIWKEYTHILGVP